MIRAVLCWLCCAALCCVVLRCAVLWPLDMLERNALLGSEFEVPKIASCRECWTQDPVARPTFAAIAPRLRELLDGLGTAEPV